MNRTEEIYRMRYIFRSLEGLGIKFYNLSDGHYLMRIIQEDEVQSHRLYWRQLHYVLRHLAHQFGSPRNYLIQQIPIIINRSKQRKVLKESGQIDLFGAIGESEELPEDKGVGDPVEEFSWIDDDAFQNMMWEKELVGVYLTGNPLDAHIREMRKKGYLPLAELSGESGKTHHHEEYVKVAGMITAVKKGTSKRGINWASFDMEDDSGEITVLAFSDARSKFEHWMMEGNIVYVSGNLMQDERSISLSLPAEEGDDEQTQIQDNMVESEVNFKIRLHKMNAISKGVKV